MSDLRIEKPQQVLVKNIENAGQKNQAEFGKVIKEAVSRVDHLGKEADRSVIDLLKGNAGIHESMIGLQKFDISMRLLLTIRNKAIEAYREIMHMQY